MIWHQKIFDIQEICLEIIPFPAELPLKWIDKMFTIRQNAIQNKL